MRGEKTGENRTEQTSIRVGSMKETEVEGVLEIVEERRVEAVLFIGLIGLVFFLRRSVTARVVSKAEVVEEEWEGEETERDEVR
jgi:hypothetical protein